MSSFNKNFSLYQICLVVLAAVFTVSCDSNGDAQRLSNLVTIADAGYASIEIGGGDADTVVEVGDSITLAVQAKTQAMIDNNLAGTVVTAESWSSSDNSIATVSSTGTVTGGATDGEVDITATFGNLIATRSVRVSSALLTEIVIALPENVTALNECSAVQFSAEGIYAGEEGQPGRSLTDRVVWNVAETSAVFHEAGLLRVTRADELTVTATMVETDRQPEVTSAPTVISVLDNLEVIDIVPDAGELAVNSPLQYRAFPLYTLLPDERSEITNNVAWTLTDIGASGNFARVDNTPPDLGLVTASTGGEGTLKAECSGTGIEKTINVVSLGSNRIIDLEISFVNPQPDFPLTLPFTGNEFTEQLIATAQFSDRLDGLDVTNEAEWTISPSTNTPFSIGNDRNNNKGLLTVGGPGTIEITATYEDENNNDAVFTKTVQLTAELQ